ncbi:hypothetical protein L7F22_061846 [Adiantum nelumboides]|nr:hypothetical protein [Adiantum nelumboides]
MADQQRNKKCKFGADGVFKAEINELFMRELAGRWVFLCRDGTLKLYVAKVNRPGLFASAQAESLCHKLLGGLAVRRACNAVRRFVMESDAKRCEIIVSGKLRGQRAKYLKFKDGYMISSGHPVNPYVDSAVRHVLFRQGVLGIKVRIMLNWDLMGRQGPCLPLPDNIMMRSPNGEW